MSKDFCEKISKSKKGKASKRKGCNQKQTFGELNPKAIKIYQYDLNGNFIKEFGCINDAKRELKTNTRNISLVAKGKRKSCCGYKWSYEKKERI